MDNISKMVILAAAALVCGCGVKKKNEPAAVTQERIPVVSVSTVERRDVAHSEVYSSTVLANVTNNIAPQTGARIQKIRAEVGDFVSAGQILAEMDRVQLDQARLKLVNDSTELARLRGLYEVGGLSKSDYDAAELGYKVSRTSYANLLENTILRAPVSGVVTARNYDRGDMYTMTQPIFTVQQITPVKLLVGISESDYSRVNRGDKVTVEADALPSRRFQGTIQRIYPTMDASSHTFNAEVIVPNADRALRPGMFARVTVTFDTQNSVMIPDIAVIKLQGSGQRMAYVVTESGVAQLRVLTLGVHVGKEYEVLSGLDEGDKVVVKGQSSLQDGVKVKVEQ
ncbi:MAG: efflux RND transporter periplasmic adaptor subunit [Bacteroidales bacterium]|nr:efflux RND transporter periplasmic adaptor subunit [Bacteroidales bacterium]